MSATPAAAVAVAYAQANAAHQRGDLRAAAEGYKGVLAMDPRHVETLHMLGVLEAQGGRFAEATALLARAVEADPGHAAVHGNLGNVLAGQGRHREALAAYERAIALDPGFADPHLNRSQALRALGRAPEALASVEGALQRRPRWPEALVARAMLLADLGRLRDALASFDEAVRARPVSGEMHLGHGWLLWSAGRNEEALASFDRAVACQPGQARTHIARSNALRTLGFAADAFAAAEHAVRLAPELAEAHGMRGFALAALKRYAEAVESYDRALRVDPAYAEALNARGSALHELGRFDEALAALDAALALRPAFAEAHANRSVVLRDLGRTDDALAAIDAALRLADGRAESHFLQSSLLQDLGRLDEAAAALERATKADPSHANAAWNACLLHLRRGEFARGWPDFDRLRWSMSIGIVPLGRREPEWKGGRVKGTLLAWGEQGIGDQVLQCSLLPELSRHAARTVVAVSPKLVPLIRRSFPALETIEFPRAAREPCEAQVPLGSVGRWLRRRAADFPARPAPFLVADPARVAQFRASLAGDGRLLCGLSWTSVAPHYGAQKSLSLRDLQPLFEVDGVAFVDLQYVDSTEERARFALDTGRRVLRAPGLDLFLDVDGAAALVAACDVVVTASNVNAHLAGGLGKPTLLLAPFSRGAHWCWGHQGESTPWYGSVRVLRQPAPGDWAGAVAQAHTALAALRSRGTA